jgi:thiosulfate/3-mercaptopyruvate sulfurtransferase
MKYKMTIQTEMPIIMNRSVASKRFVFFILIGIISGLCSGIGNARALDLGLISPETLLSQKDDWTILDGRPWSAWQTRHIPGAFSFSWENYTRTDEKKIPYRVFSPEELAVILGKIGIDERTPVAAYGDMDASWGGEAWICWVLAWIGHKGPIRLVQGRMAAWENAGFPISSGPGAEMIRPKTYHLNVRSELNVSAKAIENMKADVFIVDTRSLKEWILGGRLPGAVHIAWTDFYAGPDKTPLDAAALSKLLTKNGVGFEKPVIYYCTGGIRSSFAWLTHQLSGKGLPVNFEGGTEEWIRRK